MAPASGPTHDLSAAVDVEQLIDAFYTNARPDPLLAQFFTDVDWPHHTRRIVAFWKAILFGDPKYQGDPMSAHIQLHRRLPMAQRHFDRWLELFTGTVDELFVGPKAEGAKNRARSIAAVMAHKVMNAAKA